MSVASENQGKSGQVLVLDPANELVFRGPFKDVVTTVLKLSNPTEKRVSFKIKTTAPRHYCVRPNSGIIEANESQDISVMLQPFEYESMENKRHKFMVQSMFIPSGSNDIDKLWKDACASDITDTKLKCVFEMSPEVNSKENDGSAVKVKNDQVTPTKTSTTKIESSTNSGVNAFKKEQPLVQTPSGVISEPVKPADVTPLSTPPEVKRETATAPRSSRFQATNKKAEDDEIEALKSEIVSLKGELTKARDDGLRHRFAAAEQSVHADSGNQTSETILSQIPPIVLALISLILGYLIGKFVL